ncbi:MAG TPA: hypothetical protein VGJ27_03250 [Gaiellaceae bacterium]|jgi:hypothetical protein
MSDRLKPLLAAELAAFEAAAGEPDWTDVRRKARKFAARRLALRAGTAAVAAVFAVLAATPALGLRGHLVHLFADSEPAPAHVVTEFAQLDVAAPAGMAPGVIAAQARDVLEVPLSTGEDAVLWVAPTRSGGFCLGLSTSGRGSGGGGGCDRDRLGRFSPGLVIPGPVGPEGTVLKPPIVIDGHTLVPQAVQVEIRYQDGDVADTPVVWVSDPINAGFFVYEVPRRHWDAGHRPSILVLEDGDGHELARSKSYLDQMFRAMSAAGVDSNTGAPAEAIPSQRRELIAITTEQGSREALWVAPRRGGGRCHWLTSDGLPGREQGCPPPSTEPHPDIAAGLLSGSAPILLEGEVGEGVATLELHYRDGDVQRLKAVEGFVLGEIPSRHWPRGRRLDELVALDAEGREISRRPFSTETPGTYPCADPIELDAGVKSCP